MDRNSLSEIDPALARARDLVLKYLPDEPALWLKPPGDTSRAHPESRFYHPWFPEHQRLLGAGWRVFDGGDRWETAVLFGGKQKDENKHLLSWARSKVGEAGKVFFVVPNEYGAKSWKWETELLDEQVGKKSRLFVLAGLQAECSEIEELQRNRAGFYTTPGLFCWEKIDQGSKVLIDVLASEKLVGPVTDLGAGWGYLATQLSESLTVHLIEADRRGLDAAKKNLAGRSAHFHWADATDPKTVPRELIGRMRCVVVNPPFHTHKKADPVLGAAFAATASALLKPRGSCYLVGNSHLPYQKVMREFFSEVEVLEQRNGFKVYRAVR